MISSAGGQEERGDKRAGKQVGATPAERADHDRHERQDEEAAEREAAAEDAQRHAATALETTADTATGTAEKNISWRQNAWKA